MPHPKLTVAKISNQLNQLPNKKTQWGRRVGTPQPLLQNLEPVGNINVIRSYQTNQRFSAISNRHGPGNLCRGGEVYHFCLGLSLTSRTWRLIVARMRSTPPNVPNARLQLLVSDPFSALRNNTQMRSIHNARRFLVSRTFAGTPADLGLFVTTPKV